MLQRRQLMTAALAQGALGLALKAGSARAASGPAHDAPLRSAAFGRNPWLQPLRGWNDGVDRLAEGLRVRGRLPSELRGTLFRNGPGLLERGAQRYAHWFDGDGLVQAWRFEGEGRVSHRARFVQTRKFQLEQAAGEFHVPAFGTRIEARAPLRSPDDMNTANTSVAVQAGRLYALWEGGSATELDPITLGTLGPHAWAPELAGVPFSAHPKREPDGTLWNFGTFAGKLVLYQIGADGRLQRSQLLPLPGAPMLHDFVLTERFIVLLLPPLSLDMAALRSGRSSFAGAMRFDAQQATRALVIDKATLQPRRTLELPAQLMFHFGNGWDRGEQIELDFVSTDPDEFLSGVFNSMLGGERDASRSIPRLQFLRLDLASGRVTQHERPEGVEFPQVDPRVVGRRHRYLYCPALRGDALNDARWGFQAVQRLDLRRDRVEAFDFGASVVVEEHLLVPRPGSSREGQGWLIGTGFDVRRQRSFAAVFDAEAISAGPLATVELPFWVPYGFHGHFAPAA